MPTKIVHCKLNMTLITTINDLLTYEYLTGDTVKVHSPVYIIKNSLETPQRTSHTHITHHHHTDYSLAAEAAFLPGPVLLLILINCFWKSFSINSGKTLTIRWSITRKMKCLYNNGGGGGGGGVEERRRGGESDGKGSGCRYNLGCTGCRYKGVLGVYWV